MQCRNFPVFILTRLSHIGQVWRLVFAFGTARGSQGGIDNTVDDVLYCGSRARHELNAILANVDTNSIFRRFISAATTTWSTEDAWYIPGISLIFRVCSSCLQLCAFELHLYVTPAVRLVEVDIFRCVDMASQHRLLVG